MPDINAILRHDPRPAKFGAPLGDTDIVPEPPDAWPQLHCQKVAFVDGDYGADGTYWGGGSGVDPVYCAFDGWKASIVRIYVRAATRAAAMDAIKEKYPQAIFIRK